jgi:transposase
MANELTMDKVFAVLTLHQAGWSDRRIARELGIHRETVGRHLRLARAENLPAGSDGSSKPATNLPTGSEGSGLTGNPPAGLVFEAPAEFSDRADAGSPCNGGFIALRPPACQTTLDGVAAEDRATLLSDPSAAAVPNGTGGILTGAACLSVAPSGPASNCEPYREVVLAKLSQGLSAQRIYQDLVADHGFDSGYDSVKRFVRNLGKTLPLPFRRMECLPGDETQVDFGAGAPILDVEGHRRRPHVFRIVLSHSRKAYSEAVWREGTDEFLQCLENAFWHFGGVTRTTVIDNLNPSYAVPQTKRPWRPRQGRFGAEVVTTFAQPRRPGVGVAGASGPGGSAAPSGRRPAT